MQGMSLVPNYEYITRCNINFLLFLLKHYLSAQCGCLQSLCGKHSKHLVWGYIIIDITV